MFSTAAVDGFDAGCLTTYKSMRHIVKRLTRDEALGVIDHMIADIESKRGLAASDSGTPS